MEGVYKSQLCIELLVFPVPHPSHSNVFSILLLIILIILNVPRHLIFQIDAGTELRIPSFHFVLRQKLSHPNDSP